MAYSGPDAVLSLLLGASRTPGILWISWVSACGSCSARGGAEVPEGQLRRIGLSARHELRRVPGGLLRWLASVPDSARMFEGLAEALARLEGDTPASPREHATAQRHHDLAQVLAHAEAARQVGDPRGLERSLRSALALARGDDPRGEPGPVRIELADWLQDEGARALAAAGRGADVRLQCACDPGLACTGSQELLGRLVRNLIVNALLACARGGRVRVRAQAAGEAHLELSVEDDGRGLDPRDARELFGPRGLRARGSGLGTRSVRALVLRLGASLTVDSSPGRGTRVRLRWRRDLGRRVELLVDPLAERRERRARRRPELGLAVREFAAVQDRWHALDNPQVSIARGAPVRGLGRALLERPETARGLAVLGWQAE